LLDVREADEFAAGHLQIGVSPLTGAKMLTTGGALTTANNVTAHQPGFFDGALFFLIAVGAGNVVLLRFGFGVIATNPVTASKYVAHVPTALGFVLITQGAPAFDVGVQEGAVVFFNDLAGVTVVVHLAPFRFMASLAGGLFK